MKRSEATFELCQMLSLTTNNTQEQQQMKRYSIEEWEAIISVANRYLLTPVLYASLKEKHWLEDIGKKELVLYLEEIYLLNNKRNEGILKQLNELSSLLNEINIEMILLKGAASLSEKEYLYFGERVMNDIDILVEEKSIFTAIAHLKKNGYGEIDPSNLKLEDELGNNWHHYKRLYKKSGTASVELHRYSVGERGQEHFPLLLNKQHLLSSSSINNAFFMRSVYGMYHSFIHTQISHNYHKDKFLSLRHLHNFTIQLENCNDKEFDSLVELVKEYNLYKEFEEYLYVLKHFFNVETPFVFQYESINSQYLDKVYKRLDRAGSRWLKIEQFFKLSLGKFNAKTLKRRYSFSNKLLIIYYVPIEFIRVFYRVLTSKKRRAIIKEIVHITSY